MIQTSKLAVDNFLLYFNSDLSNGWYLSKLCAWMKIMTWQISLIWFSNN